LTVNGGAGAQITDMQRAISREQTYVWVLLLALVGLALNGIFVALERRALFWQLEQTEVV
jgi:ABC-type nitrate/sulfonate/bicarbonate transport system permease component